MIYISIGAICYAAIIKSRIDKIMNNGKENNRNTINNCISKAEKNLKKTTREYMFESWWPIHHMVSFFRTKSIIYTDSILTKTNGHWVGIFCRYSFFFFLILLLSLYFIYSSLSGKYCRWKRMVLYIEVFYFILFISFLLLILFQNGCECHWS